MQKKALLAGALAALAVLAACKKTPPANVAAVVNSRPISYAELEKSYQSRYPPNTEGSSDDQVNMHKLDLLRDLVDAEIMLQRAEKLSLMASDADIDARINELKSPYTKEEFDKQLAARKMGMDDLRRDLRRELSIRKLINKEITSHIAITDADVANFYNANKASFNLAEPQVHLAQILVTSAPDPNVRNLKNSKAQNDNDAKTKIVDIMERLKRGEDFSMLAQNFSEDPNTTANGGDMGFVPESALAQANPELRKMVMAMQPGGVSPVIHTGEGYRILKVLSKEPAGQRELNDPRVQQSIRETLLNRKDQLLRTAYYEVARNGAKVVNYMAESIVNRGGK
ncbi:MAG TPA: peptidylprolyl isomerase [Bryobacteraceae bacterium]|nr:peptidylprolyl isomerase [Bryobacteraceae bacterium]